MKVVLVAMVLYPIFVSGAMALLSYERLTNKDYDTSLDTIGVDANTTQYSIGGSRRALKHPTDQCYTQYFVGGKPPTGFRDPNSQFSKYICQRLEAFLDDTLFATMFDQQIGIAVYAAYGVAKGMGKLFGTFPRVQKWTVDQDIQRQGTNQIYEGSSQVNIQKGHLVPAETYSFDCISMVSTFKYTNAVPQYTAFNTGQWKVYEGRVRKFAKDHCSLAGGDLFLLTGTSESVLTPNGAVKQNLHFFPHNNPNTWSNIAIPNSMWTAGCCIVNDGVFGAFAAIGNNVQQNPAMHQVTVAKLENILAIGIGGQRAIRLFPGNDRCSQPESNQFRFEEGGMNPGWTKAKKLDQPV